MTYAVNATIAVPSPGNMLLGYGQPSLGCTVNGGHGTYLNIALFEKMGDLRHASLAAHGSLYNGPGISG